MSTTTSDSENNSIPDDDSEYNFYPGIYTIVESEIMQASEDDGENIQEASAEAGPYSNEPIADEEWLDAYRVRQREKEERLANLKDRLAGKDGLSNWYVKCLRCEHC